MNDFLSKSDGEFSPVLGKPLKARQVANRIEKSVEWVRHNYKKLGGSRPGGDRGAYLFFDNLVDAYFLREGGFVDALQTRGQMGGVCQANRPDNGSALQAGAEVFYESGSEGMGKRTKRVAIRRILTENRHGVFTR